MLQKKILAITVIHRFAQFCVSSDFIKTINWVLPPWLAVPKKGGCERCPSNWNEAHAGCRHHQGSRLIRSGDLGVGLTLAPNLRSLWFRYWSEQSADTGGSKEDLSAAACVFGPSLSQFCLFPKRSCQKTLLCYQLFLRFPAKSREVSWYGLPIHMLAVGPASKPYFMEEQIGWLTYIEAHESYMWIQKSTL